MKAYTRWPVIQSRPAVGPFYFIFLFSRFRSIEMMGNELFQFFCRLLYKLGIGIGNRILNLLAFIAVFEVNERTEKRPLTVLLFERLWRVIFCQVGFPLSFFIFWFPPPVFLDTERVTRFLPNDDVVFHLAFAWLPSTKAPPGRLWVMIQSTRRCVISSRFQTRN